MSHEREFDRSHSHATSPQREADLVPNRDTRSAQLDAPVHPVASGLVQRRARDASGVADDAEHAVAAAATTTGSAVNAPRSRSVLTRCRPSYSPRIGQQKASLAVARPGNARARWASIFSR